MSTVESKRNEFLQSRVWVLGFAGIHFIAHGILFITAAGISMGHFDSGEPLSFGEGIIESLAWVFSLPLIPFVEPSWFPGLFGYIPFALNSLCWGLGFWQLLRLFRSETHSPSKEL